MTRDLSGGRFAATNKRAFFLCFAILICSTLSVHAAEEGGATAESATEIFKWLNFAIVAGAILWVFGKLLPPKFRSKGDKINSAISDATAAKAEADRQLRDAETKLGRLHQEVAELRAFAAREGAGEAERIRSLSQSDAQKIFLAANAEIEAAERAARLELKAIAAKLSVDRAESLLAKQLTSQTQESLLSAFVRTLEGRPN